MSNSRKLVVQQFVTADNIVANPDGSMDFVDAQPFAKSNDEAFKAEAMAFMDTVDTMILGANTYNMFVGYWPTAAKNGEGEFADKINQLTKYIASTTLTDAPWGDDTSAAASVTADPVATIKDLKQQDGKDIVLWGSLTLMRSLFKAGLVDEIQLRICPTTRGEGTRLFDSRHELELIETKPYEHNMVVSKYRVLKS